MLLLMLLGGGGPGDRSGRCPAPCATNFQRRESAPAGRSGSPNFQRRRDASATSLSGEASQTATARRLAAMCAREPRGLRGAEDFARPRCRRGHEAHGRQPTGTNRSPNQEKERKEKLARRRPGWSSESKLEQARRPPRNQRASGWRWLPAAGADAPANLARAVEPRSQPRPLWCCVMIGGAGGGDGPTEQLGYT